MECSHPGFRMNVGCKECTIETCGAKKLRTPKPLAQFLAGYIAYDVDGRDIDRWGTTKWRELLEQALGAYQSTENVMIKIERNM